MQLESADPDMVQRKALAAWKQIHPELSDPGNCVVLQSDSKATICRLEGVGMEGGVSVIAKGRPIVASELERKIYEEILPCLPVSAPRYFGSYCEQRDDLCWYFVEDAGNVHWSRELPEHQSLAARWLAELHTSTAQCEAAKALPDRGPRHYLQRLRTIRARLLSRLSGWTGGEGAEVLAATVNLLDALEDRWSQIERFCGDMPCTLVHGDFAEENALVNQTDAGSVLLVIDWEKAGWGVPAVDFHAVDMARYWDRVRIVWPDLDRTKLERLHACGAIFGALSHNIGEKPAKKIMRYQLRLANSMANAGLWKLESWTGVQRVPGIYDLGSDTANHPATNALRLIKPESCPPARIVTLKQRQRTSVFRLEGLRPHGETIIAKHSTDPAAAVERTIYESILPAVPVSAPGYFGSCTDPSDGSVWIFTEDIGEVRFSGDDPTHRMLAAAWLATLHTSTAHLVPRLPLPDVGPDYFLDRLRASVKAVLDHSGNPALRPDDLTVLNAILQQLDFVSSKWPEIVAVCQKMPRTLVHNDFVEKNVGVRIDQSGTVLLPFDWESAGWGVPVADLHDVDIVAYQKIVQKTWPFFDVHTAHELARISRIYRLLKLIHWASEGLSYTWVERTMNRLRFYHVWLDESVKAAGW